MCVATEHGGKTMKAVNHAAQFFYSYYYFFSEKK